MNECFSLSDVSLCPLNYIFLFQLQTEPLRLLLPVLAVCSVISQIQCLSFLTSPHWLSLQSFPPMTQPLHIQAKPACNVLSSVVFSACGLHSFLHFNLECPTFLEKYLHIDRFWFFNEEGEIRCKIFDFRFTINNWPAVALFLQQVSVPFHTKL